MAGRGTQGGAGTRAGTRAGTGAETGAGTGADGASPPARRPSRSRWRDPRLAVGIAVVAACALLGGRLLAGADDTVAVWAARVPLAAGQQVQAGDLVSHRVGFADQADADRYLSADDPPPAGVLARPVGAGELVPRAALGDRATGALTELPLSLDPGAVPSSVHVGSTVDVWVRPGDPAGGNVGAAATGDTTGRRDAGSARARVVLHGVSVLALPEETTSLGPSSARQVVVGVPDDQRSRLGAAIAAVTSGTVVLTTRR